MRDALLATGAALLAVAGGTAVLLLLTVAPFVTAVDLAERRGLGTVRWGLAAAACSAVGLGCALVALRAGLGPLPVVVGAVATWAGPLALRLLGSDGGRLAGARGPARVAAPLSGCR